MYVHTGYRRRRGIGAATCPSMQQLQGITDPTDPCQSMASETPYPVTSGGTPSAIPVCPIGVRVSSTCTCPPGYALDPTSLMCAAASGTFSTPVLIGLGVLAGFLVLRSFSR